MGKAHTLRNSWLVDDAPYDKVRGDGAVRDVAILTAVGIYIDRMRRIAGFAVSLSGYEDYWSDFPVSLFDCGLKGAGYIVSNDHYGLKVASPLVFSGAKWQRPQSHLS